MTLRLLSGVLLLVAGASHAAQFRVTQSTLSVARVKPTAASWGNVAVFAGGFGGDNVLDVFVDGVRVNSTTLVENRPRAAASVYPGIAIFAVSGLLEFLDMRTLVSWAPNASVLLTSSAQENGGIGSETTSLAAFGTLDGTVDLVNASARQIIPSSLSTGRRSMGTARVRDSSGAEYLIFAAGKVILGVASSVVNVLPVSAPTAFVSAPSQLVHARTEAICTTTMANKIVCVGGYDVSGTRVDAADVCTISTSGVLSCVAVTMPSNSAFPPYAIASLGPFVLTVTYDSSLRDGLTVTDDSFSQAKNVMASPWTLWHSYTSTSSGTVAYFAGGATGIDVNTPIVTFVECLAPCEAPLIGVSASSAVSGASSLATTGGTGASPEFSVHTSAGSVAKLSALAVACATVTMHGF